jgi:hypothetical protein
MIRYKESVAIIDRPLPTPTPANGYKHKKLRSYPKAASDTSSEDSAPGHMSSPPPEQNGGGSVSETPSPPMEYQIPHPNGRPSVSLSPQTLMDCQLYPPPHPMLPPPPSVNYELPSHPSEKLFHHPSHPVNNRFGFLSHTTNSPFTLFKMEDERCHGVRHVPPHPMPSPQIAPVDWFTRMGMPPPGFTIHGHQIPPHHRRLPPDLLPINRFHPYARHPPAPPAPLSMGIPPRRSPPIDQPVCLPAGTTLECVPGDNQLLPQTQQHQQVGAGSLSPSLASSSSRSSFDGGGGGGGGPIRSPRRRKKSEDIPAWVKVSPGLQGSNHVVVSASQ